MATDRGVEPHSRKNSLFSKQDPEPSGIICHLARPAGLEPVHRSSRLLPTFQIGPLPLGLQTHIKLWSRTRELNPQPSVYDTAALPG